jgi:hypothetical protein
MTVTNIDVIRLIAEQAPHLMTPHDRLLLAQADRPARRRPDLASLAVVGGALGFVLVAWVVLSIVLGVPSWI